MNCLQFQAIYVPRLLRVHPKTESWAPQPLHDASVVTVLHLLICPIIMLRLYSAALIKGDITSRHLQVTSTHINPKC